MDDFHMTQRNAAEKEVLDFYAKMHKKGAEFFVDGTPVLWGEAANIAVEEESIYMADYVLGENGKIKQVRLDKINLLT